MVRLRALVGRPQLLECSQAAVKGALTGGEALADDIGHVMVDDELLGVHELLEPLHTEGLGRRTGDEHDVGQPQLLLGEGVEVERVGQRRRRMRPLNVERDFKVPEVVGFQARAVVRWRRDRIRATLDLDDVEAWLDTRRTVARRVVRPGLAAEMREVKGGVEDGKVLPDRR